MSTGSGAAPLAGEGSTARAIFAAWALIAALLFLRTPRSFTDAQLWAEDGTVFFKDAFERPFWSTCLRPHRGYQLLLPRLVAETSLAAVDVAHVPLVWNLAWLVAAAAALAVFASPVYSPWIPDPRLRLAAALAAAAGGWHHETLGTLANLQWFLSLAGLHLVAWLWTAGRASLGRGRTAALASLLLLAVLSAPQSFVFAPLVAAALVMRRPAASARTLAIVFLVGCLLQLATYGRARVRGEALDTSEVEAGLHAPNLRHLPAVSYYRVIVQDYVPLELAEGLLSGPLPWLLHGLALGAVAVVVFTSRREPRPLLVAAFLTAVNQLVVFAGRPHSFDPVFVTGTTRLAFHAASRYYLLPYVLLLLVGFATLGRAGRRTFPPLAFVLTLQLVAAAQGFTNRTPYQDLDWDGWSDRIERLAPGESLEVPVNPGGAWRFPLTRPREQGFLARTEGSS